MKRSLGWGLVLALACGAGCGKAPEKNTSTKQVETAPAAQETNAVITLTPEARAANHVQVVAVHRASAWVTVRCPARLEFNPDATAVVQTPMEGRLQEWRVDTGSKVRQGDVLARIENPQNLGTPLLLKAPIGGEIIERNPALGAWVQPADKLAVITDPAIMWVAVQVREDLSGQILTQAPALVRVLSAPETVFTGAFLRVSASVDPETRTVDFRFAVPNTDHKLRAGMFATAALATDQVQDKLLVPDTAVQTIHERTVVFVEQQPGQYRPTPVELGRTLGAQHEVLSGLQEGARVVTAGSFVLKSEALRAELNADKD